MTATTTTVIIAALRVVFIPSFLSSAAAAAFEHWLPNPSPGVREPVLKLLLVNPCDDRKEGSKEGRKGGEGARRE
jgi:hypothetical protein